MRLAGLKSLYLFEQVIARDLYPVPGRLIRCIQHEFYKELLSRTTDERNIEADIHLTSEEAAEEKVYE